MAKVPKLATRRNLLLIKDYLKESETGWVYSISQLGMKYARTENGKPCPLTSTRIYQILQKYGVSKNRIKKTLPTV